MGICRQHLYTLRMHDTWNVLPGVLAGRSRSGIFFTISEMYSGHVQAEESNLAASCAARTLRAKIPVLIPCCSVLCPMLIHPR